MATGSYECLIFLRSTIQVFSIMFYHGWYRYVAFENIDEVLLVKTEIRTNAPSKIAKLAICIFFSVVLELSQSILCRWLFEYLIKRMIDVHSFSCHLNRGARSCHWIINDIPCLLNQAIFFKELQLQCLLLELEHLDLNVIIERDQCAPQDLLHLHHHRAVKLVDVNQTGLFNRRNLHLRNALLASHYWVNVENKAFRV